MWMLKLSFCTGELSFYFILFKKIKMCIKVPLPLQFHRTSQMGCFTKWGLSLNLVATWLFVASVLMQRCQCVVLVLTFQKGR